MAKKTSHSYFVVRRLHSLVGIFPLGFFLVWYLFVSSYAFGGADAYNEHIQSIYSFPLIWALLVFFVGLPLLFHAVMGMVIFYTGKNNFLDYGYYNNWTYFIQRMTGIVVLIFAVLYIWQTVISAALDGRLTYFEDVQKILSPAWVKWFYILAMLALAFHFSNGISQALFTWGITRNKNSQRVAMFVGWGIFALITCWGIAILFAFV